MVDSTWIAARIAQSRRIQNLAAKSEAVQHTEYRQKQSIIYAHTSTDSQRNHDRYQARSGGDRGPNRDSRRLDARSHDDNLYFRPAIQRRPKQLSAGIASHIGRHDRGNSHRGNSGHWLPNIPLLRRGEVYQASTTACARVSQWRQRAVRIRPHRLWITRAGLFREGSLFIPSQRNVDGGPGRGIWDDADRRAAGLPDGGRVPRY